MKYGEKSLENNFTENDESSDFVPPNLASRARNRTVMLTPDVTGQVRSLLQTSGTHVAPLSDEGVFKKPEFATNSNKAESTRTVTGLLQPTLSPKTRQQTERLEKIAEQLDKTENAGGTVELKGTVELRRDNFLNSASETGLDELGIGMHFPQKEEKIAEVRTGVSLGAEIKNSFQGSNLFQGEKKVEQSREKIKSAAKIFGFLVSFDKEESGDILEVRVGRWLVSSGNTDQHNTLFINDETVSSPHAVIKVSSEGEIQVMDQLSDHGSSVLKMNSNSELDASDAPVRLHHGDLIRFGRRYFMFCAVPKMQIEN